MSSGMFTFLKQELLDQILGASAYVIPGTIYACLFSVTPDATTGFTNEISNANGYARVAYTNNLAAWTPNPASGRTKVNANVITFPACVTADWSPVVAIGFATSGTWGAGNALFWVSLNASKTVAVNDIFTIPAGQLTINLD